MKHIRRDLTNVAAVSSSKLNLFERLMAAFAHGVANTTRAGTASQGASSARHARVPRAPTRGAPGAEQAAVTAFGALHSTLSRAPAGGPGGGATPLRP